MDGWIKLHRKMLENPVVNKDPDHLAVWIYLLLNATHKERAAMWNGKKITLKAGELITGRTKIAEATGVSESKTRRVLELFKSEQQIDQQTNRHGSLISIVRWNDYQQNDQPIDQPMTNQWPTNDQPMSTIQEIKNDIKKESFSLIHSRKDDDPTFPFYGDREKLSAMRERIRTVNGGRK